MRMRDIIEVVERAQAVCEAFNRPSAVEWKKDELGWNGEFQSKRALTTAALSG